jgi:hypothetical protein
LRAIFAALALLGALSTAPGASGDVLWEDARAQRILAAEALAPEPSPAGKTIAFVRVVREDVFTDDEVVPTAFNALHATTRDEIVRAELLFAQGQTYDTARVEETTRILRRMGIFSVVRVLAVRAPDPTQVGVLVYVRDLWSLRVEQRLQLNDGHLDTLTVQLTELNLAGRAKRLTGRFNLTPLEWAGGVVYVDRRLGGGDLALSQTADLIFERASGALEGGQALLRLEDPIRDLGPQIGFVTSVFYDERVVRQVSGGVVLTYDDPRTSAVEAERRMWAQRQVSASGVVLHQWSDGVIHQAGFGVGLSDLDTDGAYRFRPEDRRRLYPVATYGGFEPRWRTYRDLATYGLTEDVRLGPTWALRLAAPLEAFGSTTSAVELGGALSVVEDFAGDGLGELAVAAEAQADRTGRMTQLVYARARAASPTLSVGRLAVRADTFLRRAGQGHRDAALVTLGGDNGLRGYPSQAFFGFSSQLARGSAEWRTRPLEWSSLHLGGVAFYDVGTVAPRLEQGDWHQSVGLGVRFLMPQFSRFAYRLDAGFPLEGGFMVRLSAGNNQSVPLTESEDELYEHIVGGLGAQPDGPRGILQ